MMKVCSFLFKESFNRSLLTGIIFLFVTICSTYGQVVQTHRFEREQKGNDEYYSVISLEDEGIALLRERRKYSGNKKLWEVLLLDTALQERRTVEFYLEERYPLIGYEVTPGRLFLLYRTGDTNKNSLVLIDVDMREGSERDRFEIKPEVDFKITHFSKVGSSLALGGYVSNDPAILLYDLQTKNLKVVPGFFQKDNELVDLRVNQNQTFNVILIDRSQRAERKLVFRTFDESGKLLLEDVIPIDEDKSLQTSISSALVREDMMVLGTWGERLGKQSGGFFSLPIDPFQDQKINYIHFGQLEHFLDYINPKRAERIRHNTKEDLQSGRKPSFTSYVIPYKIEEYKDGFFLLAEVYNPVSSANPYYNNAYGNPYYNSPYYYYNPFWPSYYPGMRYRPYAYGNNVKNVDEIKTYQTVLLSFDPDGNMMWDKSLKLDDVEKPALEQVADFYHKNANVYFVYKKESELKVKIVDLETGTASESGQKIKLSEENDEVRDEKEMEGGVKKWVGNSFFVWGYQTIRNQERKDERVRDVFYINKVVAD
jgi:hypothetical protein